MSRQYSSNNPFKEDLIIDQCGTLRYTWKVPPRENNVGYGTKKSQFDDCYGPYDNSVSYVYEIDTSNGNRLNTLIVIM